MLMTSETGVIEFRVCFCTFLIEPFCFHFILGGKRNEQLILPINDSVSGTISMDQVFALF